MANLSSINITYADNEVYVIAFQSDPATPKKGLSVELAHLQGGFGQEQNLTIIPGSVLPSGTYNLLIIGVCWSGNETGVLRGTLNYADGTDKSIGASSEHGQIGVFTKEVYEITV